MLKKPHLVAAGAVGLLVVILLSLPSAFTERVKLTLSGFFLPIFGLANLGEKTVQKAGDLVVPRSTITAENRRLKAEIEQLRFKLEQTEPLRREVKDLRMQTGAAAPPEWQLKPARIIARDPSQWWRTAEINVGKRDGVYENAPVITRDGLAGKVTTVLSTRSKIVLLGDATCQAAALVAETAEHGVVKAYPADPAIVLLTYLSKSSAVQPGQSVISSALDLRPGHKVTTSGLGGVFPEGLSIGKVVDVRNVGHGLYREARVRLAVDFSKLDRVFVVVP
ncbi:MAG: rod shape-determining protein MreC [Verrucomicrobiae bacterium]|jgi:rod shape-determining protein MreC|nr:rod shape-determining protein MreC [Verrucomicrobiae bacterium]